MFGMSFTEIVVLLLVAIIVVGPRQLPGMLRTAGRFLGQARRWLFDMRTQSGIDEILHAEGLDKDIREFRSLVKGNMVEALSIELDRGEESVKAGAAEGAVAAEETAAQERAREYPVQGCDSNGAVSEDAEAYVPSAAAGAGEAG